MLKYAAKGLLGRNIPLQNTRCSWVALDWKRRKKCKLRSTAVTTVFCLFFVLWSIVAIFVAVAAAVSPSVKVMLHGTIRNDDFLR